MVNGTYPFVEFADSTIQHRRIMSRLLFDHIPTFSDTTAGCSIGVTYELPKKIDAPIVVPAKMWMQMLKIVVVLLVAGSGDTRPQKSDDVNLAPQAESSDAGWKDVQAWNKTHDTIRDDSRYTGTSGRNRKSYITHFRDSVDLSRQHNAIGSRASGFVPTTRSSFNARRSKIDDMWTTSEFKASSSLSRTNVLGEITKTGTVRNSNKSDGFLPGGFSNNSPRFVFASNKSSDLGIDRTIDYSGKVGSEDLERPKSDASSSRNYKLEIARTRGSNFLMNHGSGRTRMSDDISIAKNRQKSGSTKPESFSNKYIIEDDTLLRRTGQVSNIPSSHIARTKISINPRESAVSTHSIHKDQLIRKSTDSIVTLHENLKSGFITDSFRHVIDAERDDLNNSGELTQPNLMPNPKSKVGYDVSRRHATTSNRNFVKLRYPFSTLNRDASNVALRSKIKNNDNVQLRESMKTHLTRTAAKRPALNDRATFHLTKNHHSSHAQNLSSQVERVDNGDTTRDEYGSTTTVQQNAYLKNWPNETLKDIENIYNHDKYTSSLEESLNPDSGFHDVHETPMILSSNDGYNHPDPIIDASVKKIINWLKVATITPNSTRIMDDSDDVHKPVDSVFESIYENLEPNRPLSVSNHDNDRYETVSLQDTPQSEKFDEINYYEEYSNPTIPQYATDSANLSPILTPSSWSDAMLLKNKTVYNPTTHVTQNTVVHILNDGLKEPNVTQLKVSQPNTISATQAASSSDQQPNLHIMSEKDKEKPPKQETNTFPSSHNCPTITINTYTHVNNTIQSKESCTDLNIIVNSHVLNTNVLKPSSEPTESYGNTNESDKYGQINDLSHQDSSNSYVTAPIGTYDPSHPDQNNYYDSQKDPDSTLNGNNPVSSELSTVEVFQNTQISVLGSSVPITNSEAMADSVADGPVGDDVAVPPAAVETLASESPVAGNPGSINSPASVNMPPVGQALSSVTGQANNGPGSLQLPAVQNLPRPGLPSTSSLSSSQGSSGSSSSSDDDDDDDDFDMSPGGMLQSVASVFTYFSLLNPLGYSFFSLAAAPFAAMAAGVLGVAAIVFPWAIPNVIDFGRAADKTTTIRFRPNVEEFVKQAVHKYNGLNEWKSRRKKRRK
ncbi:hypothetical protein EAG_15203 [Camponotus floridanus]|uniref:Uncharacterized protein n=1 Tax=Camponotus floridanus TaxID=104421 RepID=E2ATM2_CAMFO|nr:hypothetical protein EAG_15203 [Camponotus floridanus]